MTPLRHMQRQLILASDFDLSLSYYKFELIEQIKQLRGISFIGVEVVDNLGEIKFVLLFGGGLFLLFLAVEVGMLVDCAYFVGLVWERQVFGHLSGPIRFFPALEVAREQPEQINESTWIIKERVFGYFSLGNLVGLFADLFFELFGVLEGDAEELANEEQVEELFLYFGVHQDFIGHVGDKCG